MKKNEKGFGAITGLLVLLVIAILGGVGWYVWNKNKHPDSEPTKAASQAKTQSTKICDDPYKSLVNEKVGILFCYPKDWSTDVMDTASNHIVGTIILQSPDYKVVEGGFGGSNSGSKVYVSVYKIDQLDAAYTSVKSILDGTEQSKEVYTDVKPIKIANKDGATFISAYEGPRFLTNKFEHRGNQYSITLEEDLDGPKFNDNQDAYQKIVDSFELLPE